MTPDLGSGGSGLILGLGAGTALPLPPKLILYILKNGNGFGINFPNLLRYYLKIEKAKEDSKEKYEKRLRRIVSKLEKEGYIELKKIDGLLWIKPTPKIVDLIYKGTHARNHAQKAQKEEKKDIKPDFKKAVLLLLPSQRIRASELWWELNKLRLKSRLREEEIERVVNNFELYINDIKEKVLLFLDEKEEIQILEYRTRFTSESRAMEIVKTLNKAFEIASKYDEGVFLTLTLPPVFPFKIQKWILSFLLHRIKALIRKREKRNLPHIKAVEPQSSFSIHYHAVIFGTDFIMQKDQLTLYLEKHLINFLSNLGNHYKRTINRRIEEEALEALNIIGKRLIKRYKKYKRRNPKYEGPVNYITKITNRGSFVFENPPPNKRGTLCDGGFSTVLDYIKYYTIKNMDEVEEIQEAIEEKKPVKVKNKSIAFYWFLRLPFYTLSPSLRMKKERKESEWIFIGSAYVHEVDDIISNLPISLNL
ncbi:MAG: hypothetical protein QXM06_07815 [Archaeoglobaceae archaeon]